MCIRDRIIPEPLSAFNRQLLVPMSFSWNVLQEKLIGTNNWRLKAERGSGMIPRDFIINESAVTGRGDDLGSIKIRHITGGMSEILFRSYSQGREAAQGFQADIIMIDEQPKDDFWSESLVRTAATNGQVVCSFTPLLGCLLYTSPSPRD